MQTMRNTSDNALHKGIKCALLHSHFVKYYFIYIDAAINMIINSLSKNIYVGFVIFSSISI